MPNSNIPQAPPHALPPGGRFVEPPSAGGRVIQRSADGGSVNVTMPDGTLHQWDASGPRGSAGRYLGSSDGGQPQAGQTQLPSPPAETQDQQLTRLAAYQFGTANRYLANGPRVPGPSDATLDANAAGLWDKAFAAVPLQLNPAAFGLGGPQ